MVKDLKSIDITDSPELVQLVEQVRQADEPVVLRRSSEDVAIVRPMKRTTKRQKLRERPTNADDPLWKLVGAGASEGSGDIATNKHRYLADAYADPHR